MQISASMVVQWVVTAVAGFVSWLMWHYSQSLQDKFSDQEKVSDTLSKRVDKLEERVTNTIPQSISDLRTELKADIYALDGKIAELRTRVESINTRVVDNYTAFINRVDRLETSIRDNMPAVIESSLYKLILNHPAAVKLLKDSGEKNN